MPMLLALTTGTLYIVEFLFGAVLVFVTLRSAVLTFVLPRGENTFVTRVVFRAVWRWGFSWRYAKVVRFEDRDRVAALFAPTALLMLPVAWMMLTMLGYTLMFNAVGIGSYYDALWLSGSSLLTLGFAPVSSLPQMLLSFSEAMIGLALVALLIAYLPTIYSAFSYREQLVNKLEVRAGQPPTAREMFERAYRIEGLGRLDPLWREWEDWFVAVEESHTTFGALPFFRSPDPERSWVTAAGAVLDAAAFRAAVLDLPRQPQAELCLRAGYLALRRIADFYRLPYPKQVAYGDPISIAREEWDAVVNQWASIGLPIKPDREQAWRDWAGWRVNYDVVLLRMAELVRAPYAPWSSDRSAIFIAPANLRDSDPVH